MAFSRVTSFICLLFATTALAHGGHEAVPEGEAISLEPIVCHTTAPPCGVVFCNLTSGDNTNYFRNLGLHSMGSYDSYGLFFWNYLSFGYGSGCMFISPRKSPLIVTLRVMLICVSLGCIDYSLTMARPCSNCWNCHCCSGLFPRSCA